MFGIPPAIFAYSLLIILILYAFRNKISGYVNGWYVNYKTNQKRQALYNRLDRNAEGKYVHKEYLKKVDAQKKAQMKKNREKQEDAR